MSDKLTVISLRLDVDMHSQLVAVARLRGSSVTEEIRQAIVEHVRAAKSDATLVDKGRQALEEIERDAAAQKAALSAWLDDAS